TRVLLGYIPTILDSLDSGKLILMDELEAGLHPLIVDYLIGLFSSTETNPNGSQLLFTTHDTMIPRRTGMGVDQIWFASRDPSRGRTSLYPLSDFEIDDLFDFSQDYLDGRMGSIPMVRRV
ncbi:MAG: ATP-binding protein, partial [Candidatus Methanomethylophilaceae archaeon]|nr:ATP-binding protein [Candidatus Methanomethylophilaceae archaeon]